MGKSLTQDVVHPFGIILVSLEIDQQSMWCANALVHQQRSTSNPEPHSYSNSGNIDASDRVVIKIRNQKKGFKLLQLATSKYIWY